MICVTVVAPEPIDMAHDLVSSVKVSRGAPVSWSISVCNEINKNIFLKLETKKKERFFWTKERKNLSPSVWLEQSGIFSCHRSAKRYSMLVIRPITFVRLVLEEHFHLRLLSRVPLFVLRLKIRMNRYAKFVWTAIVKLLFCDKGNNLLMYFGNLPVM